MVEDKNCNVMNLVVHFLDLKAQAIIQTPRRYWTLLQNVVASESLLLFFIVLFLQIFTPYRVWYPQYIASFVLSILSIGITVILLTIQSICNYFRPNGIVASLANYSNIDDPFYGDPRKTKIWLRGKRIIFSLLALLVLVSIIFVTVNCFLLDINNSLIGFFTALGITALVYISLLFAFQEIRETRNLNHRNNLILEINEVKNKLPLELINKLNSEMKLSEEQKDKLRNEIRGKSFIFYSIIIGIINFPSLDSELKIELKNGFHSLLFETDNSIEIYRAKLDMIFSDTLEKTHINTKKALLEYQLTCLNNIRLNESFNMDYLNAYSMMFYLLKEYLETKITPAVK